MDTENRNLIYDDGQPLAPALSIDHVHGRHDEYPDARCPLCAEWIEQ